MTAKAVPLATHALSDLSSRLRQERKAHGWSYRNLSKRSGVSVSMIFQIECGRTSPGIWTIARLLTALGLSWAWLDEGGME